jgi:hypothetical protein
LFFLLTWSLRDANVSNIAAGYILTSPSKGIVRAYITSNGGLQSSVFNYANVTDQGLVDNVVTTYPDNSAGPPTVWRDFVNSNYPIFEATILQKSGAVFAGLVERRIVEGPVAAVRAPLPPSPNTHAYHLLLVIQSADTTC